jgi:hypothetical protein
MSAGTQKPARHSADVRMALHVNGLVLPIAQLGLDFLVLKSPINHPPANAEIAMSIDGHEDRWRVHLADGVQAGERKTKISRCPSVNGSPAQ